MARVYCKFTPCVQEKGGRRERMALPLQMLNAQRHCGSVPNRRVFRCFPPEEAALLAMRADLMAKLRLTIDEKKWTQAEAAKVLGIAQSRVSDLVRGKWEKFSLDMLISLASRAGLQPRLELAA